MKKTIFFSLLVLGLFFIISKISFAQWQPEVRLTNDPTSSYTSFGNARCIATNGDVIHVVWYDGATVNAGNWEIYYKRSTDKGLTWSSNVNLSNNEFLSYNPAIAVSGSYVHVAWYDNRNGNWEEYYKRSTDGGITWGTEIRLTNKPTGSGHPSIAASGLNVHLVWYDNRDGNYEIYYKRSVDGGDNWSSDIRLSNNAGMSTFPSVAVSGSAVHVAWYDSTAGNWEIYYKRSTNGGINWGADTRLTNNSAASTLPTLAVSGSIVHIVWVDNRNGIENIYYKRSTNGGSSWGVDTKLTTNKKYWESYPSIAVNGSVLHLVYYSWPSNNYEIIYKTSVNNGVSWGNAVQLTNNPAASSIPSIAVSGSSVHVIFRDSRDGNCEIYYKQYKSSAKILTDITNNNPELPKVYSLEQNYPNPFNPETKISFDIPIQGFVSLKIFDALGREVNTLVNEVKVPGSYSVDFNGTNLPSGIYFYKLQTENYSETKKMLLIK
jgi:hypothetical protein